MQEVKIGANYYEPSPLWTGNLDKYFKGAGEISN